MFPERFAVAGVLGSHANFARLILIHRVNDFLIFVCDTVQYSSLINPASE